MKSFKLMMSNVLFAFNNGWKNEKKIFISYFFTRLIDNAQWVFFTSIFMKKIVSDLDCGKDFTSIFTYILICGLIVGVIAIIYSYLMKVVIPVEIKL